MAEIFVSYAHDGEAEPLAEWLVGALRSNGHAVTWDKDLSEINPSSIQEWMEGQVAGKIVICILTQEYADRFGHGSESPKRKGVLFESRAIHLRLHDFTAAEHCPVIPVMPPGVHFDTVPAPLRRLFATRLSVGDVVQLQELLARVESLEASGLAMSEGAVSGRNREPVATSHDSSVLRQLLAGLENVRPGSPSGLSAVAEWLAFADRRSDNLNSEFARGFPDAEKIAKAAGDIDLMRRVTRACLSALGSTGMRLRWERALTGRILVCGEGWHLQRSHELTLALEATRKGVEIAESTGSRRTEAFGKKCQGRLERLIAEDTSDLGIARAHLDRSIRLLEESRVMFFGLDGSDSEEAGDCFSLEGRSHLTAFRLYGREETLSQAAACVASATSLIAPSGSKDYWDLMILSAELELENKHLAKATGVLTQAIRELSKSSDGGRSEILARAFCVRALLSERHRPRAGIAQALQDLEVAEEIYLRLGQDYQALNCKWRRMLLDPTALTSLQLNRTDLSELGRQERDPRLRLAAVDELNKRFESRRGTSIGQRATSVDWAPILRQVHLDNLFSRTPS